MSTLQVYPQHAFGCRTLISRNQSPTIFFAQPEVRAYNRNTNDLPDIKFCIEQAFGATKRLHIEPFGQNTRRGHRAEYRSPIAPFRRQSSVRRKSRTHQHRGFEQPFGFFIQDYQFSKSLANKCTFGPSLSLTLSF